MRTIRAIRLDKTIGSAAAGTALLLASCIAPADARVRSDDPPHAAAGVQVAPALKGVAPAGAPAEFANDPAWLRRELLREMDARIDRMASQAHLEARLMLDKTVPVPYLGVDSDPVEGGMKITAVYGMTGAKRAGLQVGDVLRALDDTSVPSKVALGKAIRGRGAGAQVTLHVTRDGRPLELACTLGLRPEEDEDEEEQFPDLPPLPPPSATPFVDDFDSAPLGATPPRFEIALGGHGEPPRWIVTAADHGRMLRQDSTDPTGIHFPMVLADGFDGANVVGRVRFRYAGGEVDKAAGVVLRYRDPGNYYVARANAAEGDLRIFRVANGLRHTLPGGVVKGASDDGRWHTLEFRVDGSTLTATLDGTITATACDSYFLRGRAGLWTKSDSLTEFDDLSFEPIAPKK